MFARQLQLTVFNADAETVLWYHENIWSPRETADADHRNHRHRVKLNEGIAGIDTSLLSGLPLSGL